MNKKNGRRPGVKGIRGSLTRGLLGLGLAMSGAAMAQSGFSFVPGVVLDTQGLPEAVAVGDINADGLDDLAVVNNTYSSLPLASHLLIYLQQSDGSLASPLTVPFDDQGIDAWGLELVNLDTDDGLEVVVGYYRSLLLVDYDGQSGLNTQTIATPHINDSLHSADVNRDGLTDVLALQDSGQARYLTVFYNDDKGTLGSYDVIDVSSTGNPEAAAIADLNGDGIDDLALMNGGSSSFSDLHVFLHDGLTGYLPPVSYDDSGFELARGVAATDLDGDGLDDVLLSLDAPGGDFNRVYLQNGAGQLMESGPVAAATTGAPVKAHDLDGDGLEDLIYGDALGDGLAFALRTPGGFVAEQVVPHPAPLGETRQPLALGDLNGDDCSDVATADYFSGVTVLYGQGCTLSADLAIRVQARSKRAQITAGHLGGDTVTDSRVRVRFSGDQAFQLRWPRRCNVDMTGINTVTADCFVGSLQPGHKVAYMFELSQSPGAPSSATVTIDAEIVSGAADPNPGNNVDSSVIGL